MTSDYTSVTEIESVNKIIQCQDDHHHGGNFDAMTGQESVQVTEKYNSEQSPISKKVGRKKSVENAYCDPVDKNKPPSQQIQESSKNSSNEETINANKGVQ